MFDSTQIKAFSKFFKWIEKSFNPKFRNVFFDVKNDKIIITDSNIFLEIECYWLRKEIWIEHNLLLPLKAIRQVWWLSLIQINTYVNKFDPKELKKYEDINVDFIEKHLSEIQLLFLWNWDRHAIFDDFEYWDEIEYFWYQSFIDWIQNSRQQSLFESKTIIYNSQDSINRFHEWLNILWNAIEVELSEWYLMAEFMYCGTRHRVITRSGILATDNK